jgi:hypothetical protein
MTGRQLELLPRPPRRSRGQLMHVSDAGGGCGADPGLSVIVTMRCRRCDYDSEWLRFDTVTEARRGLPCPRCAPRLLTAAEVIG